MQVALGLNFLHSNHVYHLDLKPQNVMLSTSLFVKICDFGESCTNEDLLRGEHVPARTYPYTPPELLREPPLHITEKCDVYMFGAITSEIVFERRILEFKRYNPNNLVKKL